MDLVEVVRVIRARWYVLLPLLLLTAALVVGVDKSVPTKYQSTSSLTLLASQSATTGTSTVPGSGNPFGNFNSSLNDTADFLVRRMGSTGVANDLRGGGVTEAYVVALAAGAQGPFITLSVTGTDPKHVLASLNTLSNYTQQQLQAVQQQASVKPIDMIRSMVIVPPGPPSPQTKTKTQDVLGAGIGGLVVTFLAVFVVDNIAASRKRRRRRVPFGADADVDANAVADSDAGVDVDVDLDADAGLQAESGSGSGARLEAETEPLSSPSWYPDSVRGVDALERDPFEPARPELTGRAPGPRD
jgi:hypothetical protein